MRLYTLVPAAALLVHAGLADAAAPDKIAAWRNEMSQAAGEQEDAAPPTPALWVVRDADSTLYLFGTMHARRGGDELGGAVARALAEADEVWTEIDIAPAAQAQAAMGLLQLGFDPERPLASYLSAKERRLLHNMLKEHDLPQERFANMRPWLAGVMLSVIPMMREGFRPEAGADQLVTEAAAESGRMMRFFETAEDQMRFLAGASLRSQLESLRGILHGGEEASEVAQMMEGAWASGDIGDLEAMVVRDMRVNQTEMYKSILAARNWRWLRALVRELDGAGVDFVAVGAGHMVGPDGLVALLRARGYKVTRLGE